MRRWRRPLALYAVTAVLWLGDWWWGLAATAALAGLYAWSVYRHPWRPCWRCNASGDRQDPVFGGARGRCKTCEDERQFLRWGVRFFTPSRAADLRDGILGRYG